MPLRGWGSYRGSELSEQSEVLELSSDLVVYQGEPVDGGIVEDLD